MMFRLRFDDGCCGIFSRCGVLSPMNLKCKEVHFFSYLHKSIAAKEQEDYRPLFENFIEDLLTCLNLPEWPSAENVLNLLGRLLVCEKNSIYEIYYIILN